MKANPAQFSDSQSLRRNVNKRPLFRHANRAYSPNRILGTKTHLAAADEIARGAGHQSNIFCERSRGCMFP